MNHFKLNKAITEKQNTPYTLNNTIDNTKNQIEAIKNVDEPTKFFIESMNKTISKNTISGETPEKLVKNVDKAQKNKELFKQFETAMFTFTSLFIGKEAAQKKIGGFFKTLKFFFGIEDSTDNDQNMSTEISEKASNRAKNILSEAKNAVGSTEFRGDEVDGGNLACAQVVSTVLHRAGILDHPVLSITGTVEALEEKGWQEHGPDYAPKPGDVVVWKRTTRNTADGDVQLGHGHIGIVIEDDLAFSNSSIKRAPREHKMGRNPSDGYYYRRGIANYYTPPTNS